MAGLQARLVWWKRRGVRVVQLRDLRPRAVQVGPLDVTLRVRVPDSLKLFPRSDAFQSVEPGTLHLTRTRGLGVDGFVILEAEFEELSYSHKAAKIGAEAGDVETGSSGVFAGTLVLGMHAKFANDELQPIPRLQPNEIQNAICAKSGPALQHVRQQLADGGRKQAELGCVGRRI